MQSIIVAWCNTNEKDFESFIPLEFIGKRYKKIGFSNNINVLFLDGFSKLSQKYKNSLAGLGFILHDVSKIFYEVKKEYYLFDEFSTNINGQKRYFSVYEKNTFLKWIVIRNFFSGENIVHYDGDIVLNEDPEIIAKRIAGKTFILQGCPAFTCIKDYIWFDQYEEQLKIFIKDVDGYMQNAEKEREGWEITFKTRWAGSRFREIMHEQDLQSHLIHTNRLIQDSVEDILFALRDYIIFQNPLFIHSYNNDFPYECVRKNGIDYFEFTRNEGQDKFYRKRVLFWHMQSCFNFYLSKLIFRKKYIKILPAFRLPLNLASKGIEDYINKKMRKILNHTDRLKVYEYFFKMNDFSQVLNDKIWWKKGVFN